MTRKISNNRKQEEMMISRVRVKLIPVLAAGLAIAAGCHGTVKEEELMRISEVDALAEIVITEHVSLFRPLEIELSEAWWEAITTGSETAYDRMGNAELETLKIASDRDRFARIKALCEDERLTDPVLRRQIDMLYREYLANQLPEDLLKEITDLKTKAERGYNTYRPVVAGEELSPIDVTRILAEETDSARLEETWKETKKVGALIMDDHRRLAHLRNQAARQLGFDDYYHLAAFALDYEVDWLDRLFAEVEEITEEPFRELKEQIIDPKLAARYGIQVQDLRPWHYGNQYFQEVPPGLYELNLDDYYRKLNAKDVLDAAIDFYASLGFDIRPIIERSDLYPKEGKTSHAFANKMNREVPGTSVLVMNMPADPDPQAEGQTKTLVHELSHDINYEGVDHSQPYLFLDVLSQITEAYAMLMERQVLTADWFQRVLRMPADTARTAAETAIQMLRAEELIFLRWGLVIYHFEREIYEDPDADWGEIWWKYKTRFQRLVRPAGVENPDPLAKMHLAGGLTAYYNNYAIGRFVAAQIAAQIAEVSGQDPRSTVYYGHKEIGRYLTETFFPPGGRYCWLEFIEKVTGEPLQTRFWKEQFLGH